MSYEDLKFLPRLNNVTIIGDKKFEDYGLVPISSAELNHLFLEVFGYVL